MVNERKLNDIQINTPCGSTKSPCSLFCEGFFLFPKRLWVWFFLFIFAKITKTTSYANEQS